MPKVNKKSKPARMGRPPFSESGLAVRARKVLASFTADEYELLARAAERDDTSVAKLVAERALMVKS